MSDDKTVDFEKELNQYPPQTQADLIARGDGPIKQGMQKQTPEEQALQREREEDQAKAAATSSMRQTLRSLNFQCDVAYQGQSKSGQTVMSLAFGATKVVTVEDKRNADEKAKRTDKYNKKKK